MYYKNSQGRNPSNVLGHFLEIDVFINSFWLNLTFRELPKSTIWVDFLDRLKRFWPFTTISESDNILNLISFDLGFANVKIYQAFTYDMPRKVFT